MERQRKMTVEKLSHILLGKSYKAASEEEKEFLKGELERYSGTGSGKAEEGDNE
jgi:hypothetical protein